MTLPAVLVSWLSGLAGVLAGLLIAAATAPVGVSGAVFLLPVQLSVLHVPGPAVTPTNLLFSVVATPGALARYRRHGRLSGPLTRQLTAAGSARCQRPCGGGASSARPARARPLRA